MKPEPSEAETLASRGGTRRSASLAPARAILPLPPCVGREAGDGTKPRLMRRPSVTPTHAKDDPVICWTELPLAALRANPQVTLAITPTGGHLGYLSFADEAIAAHVAVHSLAEPPRAKL